MIARIWSAQTSSSKAPRYVEYLKKQVVPTLRAVDGYCGFMLLERSVLDSVEVLVITYWQSVDALRGFAGDDVEGAVVTDEAAALLAQFDRRVRHYEVAVKDDA